MASRPFILVDRARAEQFALLGGVNRFFARFLVETDEEGVAWAVTRKGNHVFACTSLGPGWVFDRYAADQRAEELEVATRKMREADPGRHERELADAVRQIRLGPLSERLAWLIHQQVLNARSSVIKLPDALLASRLWGGARPRQWRSDLTQILEGLTWLHVAEGGDGALPALGTHTALLTHADDLRGGDHDVCDDRCPWQGGPRHHHHLINIGRGFLGTLEQFAEEEADTGVRTYAFPVSGPKKGGPTLRKVGKTGRLVTVYLPAKLGAPEACGRFTSHQHRLLQALVRETTAKPRARGKRTSEVATLTGNVIPGGLAKGEVAVPGLDPGQDHVGFNGGGVRPGLGYHLTSPGGWLAKAGYAPGEVQPFLADLAGLAGPLGLTAVGVENGSDRCHDLLQLRGMAAAPGLRPALERALVRVSTRADYVERWNSLFGWGVAVPGPAGDATAQVLALAGEMAAREISRRALALGIGADPSFVAKLFAGKKPWPPTLLEKAQAWVAGHAPAAPTPSAPWPRNPDEGSGDTPVLGVALAYRERGWSVVPQLPGAKKPAVRWKRFQQLAPSVAELTSWFGQWPGAGLAVVLGPVSRLFVIDVDGPEAHEALCARLGGEPAAPRALSGSRKPHRYHLYFQCPAVPTKAKQTPWHPKLEFRGQGGIVVIPPSLHRSGHRYEWAPGRSPADLALPPAPEEIVAALRAHGQPPASAPVGVDVPDDVQASPSTRRFLAGAHASGPRWNDRLFRAACDLAGRGLPLEAAEPLLLKGAQPWNADEEARARATIASAYAQPRSPGQR
jgi:hypothetical protein